MDHRVTLVDAVRRALDEDVGSGDVTASLVAADTVISARVVVREPAIICGTEWFDAVFAELDPEVRVDWELSDGDRATAGGTVCRIEGRARPVLTGERTALNFLQTLSGTATVSARYAQAVAGTGCRVLDTRKTIPGLRLAQKYAVRIGGGTNHRIGLYDAILIKENHIAAAGGIAAAVAAARRAGPGLPVEIEVETVAAVDVALDASVDRLMLDNFSVAELAEAVGINRRHETPAELEASGGYGFDDLAQVAATGVDFISVGALTKHLRATDFSMRFQFTGREPEKR